MKTIIERQTTGLIKKYHTLCGQLRLNEEDRRNMLVSNYGVSSSRDLEYGDLLDLCVRLERELNPQLKTLDAARKRLMASVGAWLRAMGMRQDAHIIKGIACRASKRESFNDIPLEQLRSLYAAFNKKSKDLSMVEYMTAEQIDFLTVRN
jgi:hypothetical protein